MPSKTATRGRKPCASEWAAEEVEGVVEDSVPAAVDPFVFVVTVVVVVLARGEKEGGEGGGGATATAAALSS